MSSSWLPERDNKGNFYLRNAPFKSKEVEGKSLFKRVHGVVVNCSDAQPSVFEYEIPYVHCKLNMIQIMWQPAGCRVNLEVFDDASGTYSTLPNAKLNQFGFDAGIAKDNCIQHSEYDADMYLGMKIRCTLTMPTGAAAQDICVNFGLNELK